MNTATPHGLVVGMPVYPEDGLGTVAYIVSVPTTTSFTMSATKGGATLIHLAATTVIRTASLISTVTVPTRSIVDTVTDTTSLGSTTKYYWARHKVNR